MKNEESFLNKVEKEAWDVISKFKEHPVKSILVAVFVIWFIKKVISWIREV